MKNHGLYTCMWQNIECVYSLKWQNTPIPLPQLLNIIQETKILTSMATIRHVISFSHPNVYHTSRHVEIFPALASLPKFSTYQ